jgi:3'-phosphoadenosine 5'-phosphosulfate sulfotransferase (PAPS reductase)/FAD synthetase
LKERAIWRILAHYKQDRHDKVLFVTGIRLAESAARAAIATECRRLDTSNIILCNPLLHWPDLQLTQYRWEHELPENPFYATVKGSGDCQCNWGNFITKERLQRYSPDLAAGNVATLDALSRDTHGYGWDGSNPDQTSFLEATESDGFTLCVNCSRAKGDVVESQEWRALQAPESS